MTEKEVLEKYKGGLSLFKGFKTVELAQKSINWTIFIQLIKQHLRYDYYYKN